MRSRRFETGCSTTSSGSKSTGKTTLRLWAGNGAVRRRGRPGRRPRGTTVEGGREAAGWRLEDVGGWGCAQKVARGGAPGTIEGVVWDDLRRGSEQASGCLHVRYRCFLNV